jgi:hypothetical protein
LLIFENYSPSESKRQRSAVVAVNFETVWSEEDFDKATEIVTNRLRQQSVVLLRQKKKKNCFYSLISVVAVLK